MPFRYVPLLRSKSGEATALQNLSNDDKDRVFPLVHVMPDIPAQFVTRVGAGWQGRRMALDGHWAFANTGSTVGFSTLANTLTGLGVLILPSMEVGAVPNYIGAVQRIATAGRNGVVVKSSLGDLLNLNSWLTEIRLPPTSVDLVVVAGHVPDITLAALQPPTVHALANLSGANAFRSITLASSAAPKDFGALPHGQSSVRRLDWELWNNVAPNVPFQLDYGDYGISHHDLTEPPGFAMARATVSVRYTRDADWLVIKGRPTSGATGIPMPTQYLSHAMALVGAPGFGGIAGCWGDARIQQIAAGAINSGSRPTWVMQSVSRHLSLVADRLP